MPDGSDLMVESVKTIRALERGLTVLQMLQMSGAMTLGDLHRLSGIPRATLLRILKTLMKSGVVWQRIADNAYVASYALSEMAGRIDRESQFYEVASPVMERLCNEVQWPSIFAVPRLGHMEVRETNAPRAYFDHIPLGPIGFQISYLRSSVGRAYLAFCEEGRRDAILDHLRRSGRSGDRMAAMPEALEHMFDEVRARGFAYREEQFGGHFDAPRSRSDDGRDSIGVAVRLGSSVPGAINLTWSRRSLDRKTATRLFADKVIRAAEEIAARLTERGDMFTE